MPGHLRWSKKPVFKGDKLKEADETFYVKLSNPVNAGIADNSGTGTILDDDGQTLARSSGQETLELNNLPDNELQHLKLYPNPGNGQFVTEMHLSKNINTNAKIELVNVMGQTVAVENGNIGNGTLQKSISIAASVRAGIYTVRITLNGKTYFSKLIYKK